MTTKVSTSMLESLAPASASGTSDANSGKVVQLNSTGYIPDAYISGIGGFTPLVDQWRLTADLSPGSSGVNPITSNLSRVALVGSSGMAVASGVWTFPSTGFYKIDASLYADVGSGAGGIIATMYVTTNASAGDSVTWTEISQGAEAGNYQIEYGTITVGSIIDVTSVTDVKVKFGVALEGNSSNKFLGSSTSNRTFFTFSRLGDT